MLFQRICLFSLLLVFFVGCVSRQKPVQEPLKKTQPEAQYDLPIYRVDWKVCQHLDKLVKQKVDENGCVSSYNYVWGGTEKGASYTPKAVLLRRLSGYQVAIYSHGCFPKLEEKAGEEGFYAVSSSVHLDKDFAAQRNTIEGLVEIQAISLAPLGKFGNVYTTAKSKPRALVSGGFCDWVNPSRIN